MTTNTTRGHLDGYLYKDAADSLPRQVMGHVANAIHPVGPRELRFMDSAEPAVFSDPGKKILDATDSAIKAVPGAYQGLDSISGDNIRPYSTSTPLGKRLSYMANTLGKLIPKSLLYSGVPKQ